MERIGTLLVAPSTERKAEPGRFGAALKSAANRLSEGIAGSVALAAPFVPGGAILAGALRPGARQAPAAGASGLPVSSGASSAGLGGGDIMEATRAMQLESQNLNLQYLQLQEAMQRENREFSALSNVMKVKHDTAKAAINNVH